MTDNNANWKKARIKDVSTPYTGNSIKDEHKDLYIDSINAVPYISTKDINDKFQTIDFDNGLFIKNSDKSFRRAPKNSTLLCIEGGNAGKKIAFNDRTVCFVNKLCCFHSKTENNKFLYYFLMSPSFTEEFKSRITGLIGGVSVSALRNIHIRLPALDEQEKIADFLDEKCAEIDKLSEDIQKQIDILNDYKKSVITRAVTKGLDMNVEMKDSQVDWVKNIPKTWKVTKLKYLFDFGKGLNITKADLVPEGLPVVSYGQIHSKLNDKISLSEELLRFVDNRYQVRYPQCRIKQGNFVFADTSEDYEGCGNCVYKRDNSKVFAGYHSIILKAKQNSDNRYLAYLFTTDLWRKQIRTAVSGVKVFSITQNILSRASVILPPEKEKLIIADYLDSVCSDIEYSISAKYSQLENLTIYKKSIIYEYVTGKKRVV